jgi:phosphoribosyl 1,2-cyclic phosphate phosphodiesterase
MGLDELRRFNVRREEPIPAYAAPETWVSLRRSFYYVFDGVERRGGGVPRIQPLEIAGPFAVGAVRVVPIQLWHGDAPILGFRLGQFAYLTDCSGIPDDSWPLLAGIRTLVIDALRHRPHATHFTVAEALEAIARIAPGEAWLTHMCHDLGHEETNRALPPGVQLAYDGLTLDVGVEIA